MTTTTSMPFSNANARSRYASLKGAFVAAFVAALTAGFVAHATQGPASAETRAPAALVALR
jgi:hypothetical protein